MQSGLFIKLIFFTKKSKIEICYNSFLLRQSLCTQDFDAVDTDKLNSLPNDILYFPQIQILINANFFNEFRHMADHDHCSLVFAKCFSDNRDMSKINMVGRLV